MFLVKHLHKNEGNLPRGRHPTIAQILASCPPEPPPPHDCYPARKFSGSVVCGECGRPWTETSVLKLIREEK